MAQDNAAYLRLALAILFLAALACVDLYMGAINFIYAGWPVNDDFVSRMTRQDWLIRSLASCLFAAITATTVAAVNYAALRYAVTRLTPQFIWLRQKRVALVIFAAVSLPGLYGSVWAFIQKPNM